MAPRPRPGASAEDYRYWTDERVRFNDLDVLGHVNNIAYAIYVETGRADFLADIGFWVMGAERQNMILRPEMDYLREVRFPSALRIGVAVRSLGRCAFTLGIGVFHGDECVLVAVNVDVIVRFHARTRSAVVINAEEREMLAPHCIRLPVGAA